MKRLLIPTIAIIIFAIASCTKQPASVDATQAPVDSVGEKNKEMAKKLMEAVTSGDTIALASYLADGFMQHGPAIKDSANKEQDLKAWGNNWKNMFSSLKYDEAAVLAYTVKAEMNPRLAGDWVMKWGTISAEYKNGMPPVKFSLHLTMRIANGKVEREYVYYNVADILAQQGFTFEPPKKGGKKK